MESRDILKVKDQLKDPTKIFETCWLLGCPTTTRKPGLKDFGISKARNTELCIQSSRQAFMRLRGMFGTAQRIRLENYLLTEHMYSSVETEEELEQLFNAGRNNGRDKEDKEEANQRCRKDEDENQTNDISEERVEKKDNKKVYCVICEKESSGGHKCSVCDQFVYAICESYSEDGEGFGLKVTCNLCVRKNRINVELEGAKSGQEQQAQIMVSLSNSRLPAVDIGTNVVVRVSDLDRGSLALRNVLAVVVDVSSSGLYLLGTKEGLLERLYARNEFTTADNFTEAHDVPSSSLSLRSASMIMSGSKQGSVSCHCKRYCVDKKRKCISKNIKCKYKCHSNSSCKNK